MFTVSNKSQIRPRESARISASHRLAQYVSKVSCISPVVEESARVSPVPEIRGLAQATRTSVRESAGTREDSVLGEAAAAACPPFGRTADPPIIQEGPSRAPQEEIWMVVR